MKNDDENGDAVHFTLDDDNAKSRQKGKKNYIIIVHERAEGMSRVA